MQFDDRLSTVLRMRADGDVGLRTQFRQLLDLLGTSPQGADESLLNRGYNRLKELGEAIPQEEQSRIMRQGELRLRDVRLVKFLANQDAKPAASAMATARLTEEEWLTIIPDLPVNSRGFLRHRRDLSLKVRALLKRLGVQDLVLPDPMSAEQSVDSAPLELVEEAAKNASDGQTQQEEISVLLQRIADFREGRRPRPVSPRLPLEDDATAAPLTSIEFALDADGMVSWAEKDHGSALVGMHLFNSPLASLVTMTHGTKAALLQQQPITTAPLAFDLATEAGGAWLLDAAPLFDPLTGAFTGYRCCVRRPVKAEPVQAESGSDRMRQVLHELRTPVNAIQGFAEIIQQQLFGPAPHEYRAHAASISVDAAKLLAGFDEVDRFVKLESDAMALTPGEADMRECVAATVQRLQSALRARSAGFSLTVSGDQFIVGIDPSDLMALCWRLLASAAAALAPGEEADLLLSSDKGLITLEMDAPQSIIDGTSADPVDLNKSRAVSAGAFGPFFAFRLAQAEARSAQGKLFCKTNRITLTLPALTATNGDFSAERGRASG